MSQPQGIYQQKTKIDLGVLFPNQISRPTPAASPKQINTIIFAQAPHLCLFLISWTDG
jgi:hypothetical protein